MATDDRSPDRAVSAGVAPRSITVREKLNEDIEQAQRGLAALVQRRDKTDSRVLDMKYDDFAGIVYGVHPF